MKEQNSLQSGLQAKEIDLFVCYGVLLETKTLAVHRFQMFFFSPRCFGKVILVQRGQRGVDTWLVVNRLTTRGRRVRKTVVIVQRTAKSRKKTSLSAFKLIKLNYINL